MFTKLFSSDKAPFALSLAITVLGWLFTTMVSNLSDVIILGVDSMRKANRVVFTVINHSVKQPLASAVINFRCPSEDCMVPVKGTTYVIDTNIRPYSDSSNIVCSPSAGGFTAVLNLPPSAMMQYEIRLIGRQKPIVGFEATVPDLQGCPSSDAKRKVENVWVVEGPSVTLWLIDYHLHLLALSMLVTLCFFFWVLFRPSPKEDTWS